MRRVQKLRAGDVSVGDRLLWVTDSVTAVRVVTRVTPHAAGVPAVGDRPLPACVSIDFDSGPASTVPTTYWTRQVLS